MKICDGLKKNVNNNVDLQEQYNQIKQSDY